MLLVVYADESRHAESRSLFVPTGAFAAVGSDRQVSRLAFQCVMLPCACGTCFRRIIKKKKKKVPKCVFCPSVLSKYSSWFLCSCKKKVTMENPPQRSRTSFGVFRSSPEPLPAVFGQSLGGHPRTGCIDIYVSYLVKSMLIIVKNGTDLLFQKCVSNC